jgi:uncharacterized SAM-binding protein YcdF (DUF218 family)
LGTASLREYRLTPYELAKLGGFFVSPLVVVIGLWLFAAVCLLLGRRRLALGLSSTGFVLLWVASMPVVANALAHTLESQYPVRSVEATPAADAIIVLGGALIPANPPSRPSYALAPAAGRVWHAAQLYKAGKAKWIVVAAGNQPGFESQQIEADAISDMLKQLGVPSSAIRLDTASRNTRENAANAKLVLQDLGVRRILLVTSAQHMPRAVTTFKKVWANSTVELIPAGSDSQGAPPPNSWLSWIPSPNALLSVTKALKEIAGMIGLAII